MTHAAIHPAVPVKGGSEASAFAAAPPTQAIASLKSARFSYGNNVALDGVTLNLAPGQITALLGPNGAGKTTAVRLLLGLLTAQEGSVRVFGGDPRRPEVRRHLGTMLQVGRAPETLKVREHIECFRAYYPHPLPYAEVVRIAQLDSVQERLFGALSGGQKQRVFFALALCGDPDLLILDEPTVGLDIESRRALWEQIRAMAKRGKSVLLTTHYLEEADALADRVVVIQKGRIIADGTPAHIKQQAAGRTLSCRTSLAQQMLREIPGVLACSVDRGVATLSVRNADEVLRVLLALDPKLTDLEISSQKLEDAFLALTQSA
jgi:ABC-2 type transport system ATP-binding protein